MYLSFACALRDLILMHHHVQLQAHFALSILDVWTRTSMSRSLVLNELGSWSVNEASHSHAVFRKTQDNVERSQSCRCSSKHIRSYKSSVMFCPDLLSLLYRASTTEIPQNLMPPWTKKKKPSIDWTKVEESTAARIKQLREGRERDSPPPGEEATECHLESDQALLNYKRPDPETPLPSVPEWLLFLTDAWLHFRAAEHSESQGTARLWIKELVQSGGDFQSALWTVELPIVDEDMDLEFLGDHGLKCMRKAVPAMRKVGDKRFRNVQRWLTDFEKRLKGVQGSPAVHVSQDLVTDY